MRAFENINFGRRQGYDAVLTWDGYPVPQVVEKDGRRVEAYPNPRRPEWPEAEFIVGNPPFIGGKDLRSRMAARLRGSAVGRAPADERERRFRHVLVGPGGGVVDRKETTLRRFGFVTTNSISQVFQRRVMERHLNAKTPDRIRVRDSDHPWTKAAKDSAAVRIAMTVVSTE